MCLGVPGQIVAADVARENELPTARVSFAGLTRSVCTALVPEAKVGDFVLVHAGLALQILDDGHASELLDRLRMDGRL